jgi:hypothetical protein
MVFAGGVTWTQELVNTTFQTDTGVLLDNGTFIIVTNISTKMVLTTTQRVFDTIEVLDVITRVVHLATLPFPRFGAVGVRCWC